MVSRAEERAFKLTSSWRRSVFVVEDAQSGGDQQNWRYDGTHRCWCVEETARSGIRALDPREPSVRVDLCEPSAAVGFGLALGKEGIGRVLLWCVPQRRAASEQNG